MVLVIIISHKSYPVNSVQSTPVNSVQSTPVIISVLVPFPVIYSFAYSFTAGTVKVY